MSTQVGVMCVRLLCTQVRISSLQQKCADAVEREQETKAENKRLAAQVLNLKNSHNDPSPGAKGEQEKTKAEKEQK